MSCECEKRPSSRSIAPDTVTSALLRSLVGKCYRRAGASLSREGGVSGGSPEGVYNLATPIFSPL